MISKKAKNTEDKKAIKEKKKKVKKTKNIKKHDTVVFVDSEEEAKKVLMEVLDAPVNASKKEMKKHFVSEVKALLMILLIIGAVVGAGFAIFKFVKPFESKKPGNDEETKVVESSAYKTLVYKASEDRMLSVVRDKYLIEYHDNTLYKVFDMDGNILFEGTETYTDVLLGTDGEFYLTLLGANQERDYASMSVYKLDNKEFVEVFTAADEDYSFTTLYYKNNNDFELMGVVGENYTFEDEGYEAKTILYTLDGEKKEEKGIRFAGDKKRNLISDSIISYSKDYVVIQGNSNGYKYGVYDLNDKNIILNIKYDGLYTTVKGDYIAIKGKKAGIVDVKSKILLDFKYDFIYDAESFYVVAKDKKLGIFNNEFKQVIKPTFAFQENNLAGFAYDHCCGTFNSFDTFKRGDKYVLTINVGELGGDVKYKIHETYIIDANGEYLTIGANEFKVVNDFIYGYDSNVKKYFIYDDNFAEKYSIDISNYDFRDSPNIFLSNENTIVVSLDTKLYYDYSTGDEIDSLKDAAFIVDKIEFKYSSEEKVVSIKVNGELIGEFNYQPTKNEYSFYNNLNDKLYYYLTDNTYVMVRKSE